MFATAQQWRKKATPTWLITDLSQSILFASISAPPQIMSEMQLELEYSLLTHQGSNISILKNSLAI